MSSEALASWRDRLLALLRHAEAPHDRPNRGSYAERALCSLVFQALVEGADSLLIEEAQVVPCRGALRLEHLAVPTPPRPDVIAQRVRDAHPIMALLLEPAEHHPSRFRFQKPPTVVREALAAYDARRRKWFAQSRRPAVPDNDDLMQWAHESIGALAPDKPAGVLEGSLHVLIVDDDPGWRDLIVSELEFVSAHKSWPAKSGSVGSGGEARDPIASELDVWPVTWEWAGNASAARDLVSREQFHVVIIDRVIPEAPGKTPDAVHGDGLRAWIRERYGVNDLGVSSEAPGGGFADKSDLRVSLYNALDIARKTMVHKTVQEGHEAQLAMVGLEKAGGGR